MKQEQYDRILALRSEGYTYKQIEALTGCSDTAAYNVCKGITKQNHERAKPKREGFRRALEQPVPIPPRPHALPGITLEMLMGNGRRRVVW